MIAVYVMTLQGFVLVTVKIILLVFALLENDIAGLSSKALSLYCLVYATRVIECILKTVPMFYTLFELSIFGLTLINTICVSWKSINPKIGEMLKKHDTFNGELMIVPCMLLSCYLIDVGRSMDPSMVFWKFSFLLEAVAMLPQYHFLKRHKGPTPSCASDFVGAMAIYHSLTILNTAYCFFNAIAYEPLGAYAALIHLYFYMDYIWNGKSDEERLARDEADKSSRVVVVVDRKTSDDSDSKKSNESCKHYQEIVLAPSSLEDNSLKSKSQCPACMCSNREL
ncbi:hypothetical protein TKK_0017412 [Trichogramma kaykai]|uniref:XK-related protein n=1 Tax=Trichogramma kaykai TaxID=54128 RepID=A0ABD2W2R8_9HYME